MKIYIIRHGQDDDTVRGGWSDCSITDLGIKQANTLAENLMEDIDAYNIGKIISSDLCRAMQTAEIIADALGVDVEAYPEFREVNNGDLAGMKNEIADKLYPDLYWRKLDWEQRYPNGESPKDFYERIYFAWNNLKEKYKSYDKNILIVTHGGVINIIKAIVNAKQYSNKNKYCGVRCCEIDFVVEI